MSESVTAPAPGEIDSALDVLQRAYDPDDEFAVRSNDCDCGGGNDGGAEGPVCACTETCSCHWCVSADHRRQAVCAVIGCEDRTRLQLQRVRSGRRLMIADGDDPDRDGEGFVAFAGQPKPAGSPVRVCGTVHARQVMTAQDSPGCTWHVEAYHWEPAVSDLRDEAARLVAPVTVAHALAMAVAHDEYHQRPLDSWYLASLRRHLVAALHGIRLYEDSQRSQPEVLTGPGWVRPAAGRRA